MVVGQPRPGSPGRAGSAIIDSCAHNVVEDERVLFPYLPQRWRRHFELFGARRPSDGDQPHPADQPARPPGAGQPHLSQHLLDAWGLEHGILVPVTTVGRGNNLELDAALATAVNDWQAAEWLDPEPRLRASIVVACEDPARAVEEVERRAPDRRFVQVRLPANTRAPLGDHRYWPIYEAAAWHGLPVCVHGSGSGGYPTTGAGWPSLPLEQRAGSAQAAAASITSLVFNGVFERFERLAVVLAGSGLSWVPPLMWRLDGCWRVLRDEVPELKRLPSEHVREHVYFAVEPAAEAPDPERFGQLVRHLGFDDRIMLASGYPLSDLSRPEHALPAGLPTELAHRVLYANARALFAERL